MRPAGPRHLRRSEPSSSSSSSVSVSSSGVGVNANANGGSSTPRAPGRPGPGPGPGVGGTGAQGGPAARGNMNRDQVFASIFGRSAGGHHVATGPQGGVPSGGVGPGQGGLGRQPSTATTASSSSSSSSLIPNGRAAYGTSGTAVNDPYAGFAPPLPPMIPIVGGGGSVSASHSPLPSNHQHQQQRSHAHAHAHAPLPLPLHAPPHQQHASPYPSQGHPGTQQPLSRYASQQHLQQQQQQQQQQGAATRRAYTVSSPHLPYSTPIAAGTGAAAAAESSSSFSSSGNRVPISLGPRVPLPLHQHHQQIQSHHHPPQHPQYAQQVQQQQYLQQQQQQQQPYQKRQESTYLPYARDEAGKGINVGVGVDSGNPGSINMNEVSFSPSPPSIPMSMTHSGVARGNGERERDGERERERERGMESTMYDSWTEGRGVEQRNSDHNRVGGGGGPLDGVGGLGAGEQPGMMDEIDDYLRDYLMTDEQLVASTTTTRKAGSDRTVSGGAGNGYVNINVNVNGEVSDNGNTHAHHRLADESSEDVGVVDRNNARYSSISTASRLDALRQALIDDDDEEESPPPEYSTTAPQDHRSSVGSSSSRVPEIVRDVKGLNLYTSSNSPNASPGGADWTRNNNVVNSSWRETSASPGRWSSDGGYRRDGTAGSSNRSRYGGGGGAQFGLGPEGSIPVSASNSNSNFADELRDSVHPVVTGRPETYGQMRTHRRQGSESSIVSTSTIQSGYMSTSRRSGAGVGLTNVDTTRWNREDHTPSPGSPAMSLQGAEGFSNPARMSTDSIRSLPQGRISHTPDNRAMSFSGQSTARELAVSPAARAGSVGHGARGSISSRAGPSPTSSATNISLTPKQPSQIRTVKTPHVYPAMMSRVAEVFKHLVPLGDRVKDGLTYKDSFEGREAVDLICDIIRTSDRNLALLLGRALDSQKFFHDVTYNHRLRDTGVEIYRFKERLPSPFVNGTGDEMTATLTGAAGQPNSRPDFKAASSASSVAALTTMSTTSGHSNSSSSIPTPATSTTTVNNLAEPKARRLSEASSEDALPVGVFTLLTDCYSPTCSRDQLCYSINCPRRLEQQKRLNMEPEPGLTRRLSTQSLGEIKETGTLWIHSVSQEILDSVDDNEKARQEAINELIYTERDFVRDMEYLRDSWVTPLRTNDVIPAAKREDFITQVFWNVHEVLAVNSVLGERLTKRQKQEPVVQNVGDLFLDIVPRFDPFVRYGAHQLFGKYEFEKEKGNNPAFQKFVDETERHPSSRKLELNGYLTKPTTRLARYPLLLAAILKKTPENSQDQKDLPEAIKLVKEFLARVNIESGKSENMFNLAQLDQQLVFRPGEQFDLHLRDKNRELVYKGPLKCRGGPQGENADLLVFLFDHALLLVKPKWINKHEQYKVYRKPIPLELLVLTSPDEQYNTQRGTLSKTKSVTRPPSTKGGKDIIPKPESKHGYSLTLIHLGRKGYTMTLWAATYAARKKWLEHIEEQQSKLRDRNRIFDAVSITDRYFGPSHKLNCAVPYDGGRRMIYGSDDGVYFSNLRDERLRFPTKVLTIPDVTQVDVLEEFQLLIVLAERSVTSYPLEALDPNDPTAALKRGKRLSSHTSFFKSGICLGRTLLCIVKSSSLSSTIKTLEPVNLSMRNKKQPTPFRKLLANNNEPFTLFKEFYIPTESTGLSFLKTKLCVATTRGFEVVDLETLDTQGLLDPSDHSLDFVSKRENVHPIAIYRVEENFLLCYAEFAFYVNKTGWRAKHRWAVQWEGYPHAFALHYPYVLAFEPNFVEVRHVDTGNLVQIITGANIRCLFSDTPPSTIHSAQMLMTRPPVPHHPQMQHGGHMPMHPGHPQYNPYGPPPPPAPQQPMFRPNVRSQIIFISEDSNVQVMRLITSPTPPVHPMGSMNGRR